MRKSPVRHNVKRHKRSGKWVESFERGKGSIPSKKMRSRKVVGEDKPRVFSILDIKRDRRYASFVREGYEDSKRDIVGYLRGQATPIAKAENDQYTVVILPNHKILFILNDRPDEPVPCGRWMDFPEEHWGLTDREYKKLPRNQRAQLEAEEQLNKWIDIEYYNLWFDFYMPKLYDRLWWGGKVPIGMEKRNKFAKKIVEKEWMK